MNTQQKNPKRSPMRPDYLVILIIIVVAIGLYFLFTGIQPEKKILTQSEFIAEVESGNVLSFYAEYVGGDNLYVYQVVGLFKQDPEQYRGFEFTILYDDLLSIIDEVETYNLAHSSTPVTYAINVKVSFDIWSAISTLIMVAVPIIIAIFIFRTMASQNNRAIDFTKNRARLSRGRTVRFDDVAGADEEKAEMAELIDFLKNPKKYVDMGARIPKGVLLVGSPGTGKTLLAKAVAGEADVPFFSISGSDFVELYVGVGASRVRDLFRVAKENAPCIIFVDEIDAVGRQRGAGLGGGNDEREQTLNQLLVEMDGFTANLGIIIIAATNRPDVLDPALLRPGRFDRQITMQIPDVKAREAILKVHAKSKKLDPQIKFSDVAMRIPGFTGADIENLLNEAALLAARDNRTMVNIQDLDEAVDRVIMGPAKKSRKYSPKEKEMVAYHEAGHAVIGIKLPEAQIVQKVTVIPRGRAGGYNLMMPAEEKFTHSRRQLLAEITSFLGGRVAEEIMFDDISTGAYDDFKRATRIARAMVTEYGMSDLGPIQYESDGGNVFLGRDYLKEKNFSDAVALEIDKEVRKIIMDCYDEAKRIISENHELLDKISHYLIMVETLNKSDIDEIVATGKLSWYDNREQQNNHPKDEPSAA